MMKRRIGLLLLLMAALLPVLLTAACNPKATPTPTATARPVATQAPPTATATPSATPTSTATPTATLDPNINPLTGEHVSDSASLAHRVILVRYGHDRVARPPFGLSQADVVFEELAEGGSVTRITGVYLSELPEQVGPIRSARLVVLDELRMLNAVLVYAGASDGVQWLLSQEPYPIYSHVGRGSDLFYRVASRPSPHNLFVRLPDIRQRMIAEKVDEPAEIRGWIFSATTPSGKPITQVHIPYWGQAPVDYQYHAGSGTYLRFVEGVPHTDGLNNQQISAANVAIVYAEHKDTDIVEDKLGNVSIAINLIGQGRLQLFRDGVMIEGTWQRDAANHLLRFHDAAGNDIPLKPGNTWVQFVPLNYQVTVQ